MYTLYRWLDFPAFTWFSTQIKCKIVLVSSKYAPHIFFSVRALCVLFHICCCYTLHSAERWQQSEKFTSIKVKTWYTIKFEINLIVRQMRQKPVKLICVCAFNRHSFCFALFLARAFIKRFKSNENKTKSQCCSHRKYNHIFVSRCCAIQNYILKFVRKTFVKMCKHSKILEWKSVA